jgi:hypothetical protein
LEVLASLDKDGKILYKSAGTKATFFSKVVLPEVCAGDVKNVTLEFCKSTGNVSIRTAGTIEDKVLKSMIKIEKSYLAFVTKGQVPTIEGLEVSCEALPHVPEHAYESDPSTGSANPFDELLSKDPKYQEILHAMATHAQQALEFDFPDEYAKLERFMKKSMGYNADFEDGFADVGATDTDMASGSTRRKPRTFRPTRGKR